MKVRSDIPEGPVPALRAVDVTIVTENDQHYAVVHDPYGFSEKQLAFAYELLPLLTMFDGNHTLQQIADQIEAVAGEAVPVEALAEVVNLLDDSFFLHNDRFREHRKEVEEAFRKDTVRKSSMAGSGYPDDPKLLGEMLEHFMAAPPAEDHEPDEVPEGARIRGIMSPHIDYERGGMTYGRTYKVLREHLPEASEGPLLLIVIGVGHAGALSPIVVADKTFQTPLGDLPVDQDAIRLIREWVGDRPFNESFIHKAEHSVELQAVWLKHLLAGREITMLPILAGILPLNENGTPEGVEELEKVMDALFEIERRHEGPVLWVGGVDCSHVGPRFGDQEPVDDTLTADVLKRDMAALEQVRNVDAEEWWHSLMDEDNPTRVCGLNAMYLLLKGMQGAQGYIIDYDQAVSEDRMQMVSFAGGVFC